MGLAKKEMMGGGGRIPVSTYEITLSDGSKVYDLEIGGEVISLKGRMSAIMVFGDIMTAIKKAEA